MAEITMAKALNTALRDAMRADPRTLVFGEDVGKLGGVFRITDGLAREFGDDRCFDTPSPSPPSSAPPSAWPCTATGRSSRCSSTPSPTPPSNSSSATSPSSATAPAAR
ncbi:hypothetical protein GCM10020000_76430 [Streptomyces olivoverticillatus]